MTDATDLLSAKAAIMADQARLAAIVSGPDHGAGSQVALADGTLVKTLARVASESAAWYAGLGYTPADFASSAYAVDTLAALKALTVRPPMVATQGYTAAGDGGGGPPWRWVAGSTATADDFLVVNPTSGAAGRYIRMIEHGTTFSPKWGGAGLGPNLRFVHQGAWATSTAYAVNDVVTTGGASYYCATAHTAGTFATDLAAVKWVLLGNDTTRFAAVVAAASANGCGIDLSGCTCPIDGVTIAQSSKCSGIFSFGSGQLISSSATTSSTFWINVYKSDFCFDRVLFTAPISHVDGASPAMSTMVAFEAQTPAATTSRQRVANCQFRGGATHLQFRNTTGVESIDVTDNKFTDSWAVSCAVATPRRMQFSRNEFYQCSWGANLAAGVCIFLSNFSPSQSEDIAVVGNIFSDCQYTQAGASTGQEAIDWFGGTGRNLLIANNICHNVGNGFLEFKSDLMRASFTGTISGTTLTISGATGVMGAGQVVAGAGVTGGTRILSGSGSSWVVDTSQTVGPVSMTSTTSPDFYGDVLITGNVVNFGSNGGIGVALNGHANGDLMDGISRWAVIGNTFYSDAATKVGIGVTIGPYSDVFVGTNAFECGKGVLVSPSAGSGTTEAANRYTIQGNKLNCDDTAIQITSRTHNTVVVTHNTAIGAGRPLDISGNGQTINNLICEWNHLEVTASSIEAVLLQNIQGGLIANNRIKGLHKGIHVLSTGTCANLRIADNTVECVFNAFSFDASTASATVIVANNKCSLGASSSIIGVASGTLPVAYGNERDALSSDPSATICGSLGDIVPNSAPTAGGVLKWVCTTAGAAGAATFKGVPINA